MCRATAAGCSESTAGSASSGCAGESCSASRTTSSSSSSCTPRPTSSTRTPAGARWRNSRGNGAWTTPWSRPASATCTCGSTTSMGSLRPAMLRVLKGFPALAVALLASGAAAQYPSKPVRLLVPIPPGGGPDLVGRLIAARLTDTLGQPVVVENRVGGNGVVAGEAVAKAAPDGYTLLVGMDSLLAINPHLYERMPFDPLSDLAPVASLVSNGFFLVVNPQVPAQNLAEFIEYAKRANPPLQYASGGNGSQHHLTMERLKGRAGIALAHIPYKGGAPATTATVSGEVAAMMSGTSTAPPSKAGRRRVRAAGPGNRRANRLKWRHVRARATPCRDPVRRAAQLHAALRNPGGAAGAPARQRVLLLHGEAHRGARRPRAVPAQRLGDRLVQRVRPAGIQHLRAQGGTADPARVRADRRALAERLRPARRRGPRSARGRHRVRHGGPRRQPAVRRFWRLRQHRRAPGAPRARRRDCAVACVHAGDRRHGQDAGRRGIAAA